MKGLGSRRHEHVSRYFRMCAPVQVLRRKLSTSVPKRRRIALWEVEVGPCWQVRPLPCGVHLISQRKPLSYYQIN